MLSACNHRSLPHSVHLSLEIASIHLLLITARIMVDVPCVTYLIFPADLREERTHNRFLKRPLATGSVLQLSNPVETMPGTSTTG
jgi:hypothetical protein